MKESHQKLLLGGVETLTIQAVLTIFGFCAYAESRELWYVALALYAVLIVYAFVMQFFRSNQPLWGAIGMISMLVPSLILIIKGEVSMPVGILLVMAAFLYLPFLWWISRLASKSTPQGSNAG